MKFTLQMLQTLKAITVVAGDKLNIKASALALVALAKKCTWAKEMLAGYTSKVEERSSAKYVNQKCQTLVANKCFTVTNTKYTSGGAYVDSFSVTAATVAQLQALELSYTEFKQMFALVSLFVLCNYSTTNNVAKHERFYSQCLQQVELMWPESKRHTESIIHSRSRNIKVKAVTLKNVEREHLALMAELAPKTKKAKTAKLVKAKAKRKAKVTA